MPKTGFGVEVRLLGPVDVLAADGPRAVDGRRRKAILATLALHGSHIVSTGTLIDAVWGQAAPTVAVNTLQTHMSYLRAVLGSKTAILARPPGYVLHLEGDGTDVRAAERLLRESTRAADPAQEVRLLREALTLWRGRPLADVARSAWLEEQAAQLELLRVQVERALAEARLAAGEHAELVLHLEQLAGEHPLDEQLHAQLMLALYRCGRQADALAVYHRLRRTLAQELGIDPSRALRELETAILRQDQALAAPTLSVTVPLSSPATATPAGTPAPGLRRWCWFRRNCRTRWPHLPGARPSWRAWMRSCPTRPRPVLARPRSRRSRAQPGWARPRWPCSGHTGSPGGSQTGSCM